MAPYTVVSELDPYLNADWQLIPLHRWDYHDQVKGKSRERGKSPADGKWTTKIYKNKDQVEHLEAGANVGVRLRATDLVIDVDPRNFKEGDDPFARLCEDCGLDPDLYPTVETGSGGLHVYMTKPENVSVRDSLEDYEGVEFKTIGRQVVSAGSIHPGTQKNYMWDFLRPGLGDVIAAPDRLINIIRRPARALSTGGGEHTQEELAEMLEALDPTDFTEHGDWLTLMQACHHATAGDGRSEFIEWSTGDPEYSDHSGIIGRRWDSLHADNDGGNRVTYRTLYKILMDNDAEDVIPRRLAEDDFEALGPEDIPVQGLEEHEQKGPLEKMNDKYCAVLDGSQFKIFWEVLDPSTADPENNIKARKRWVKATEQTFVQWTRGQKIQTPEGKVIAKSEAWLDWGGRKQAEGVIFDPERDHPGFLNLWTGWGHEPRKGGSWAMLNELLFEVLCDGDQAVYDYVMDWASYLVQHPSRPAEVAICFKGGKGTGKGTWGRALVGLAGKHGMHITSPDQITGRFNDHLRDVILLFADEAITPYNKAEEGRLKGLITEPRIAYEGKGKDIISDRNMLHIMMASNEDWFVPFGLEERRFMVQQANNKRKGDIKFFEALNKQLDGRGYSALLWDLMQRDIGDWAPRKRIPATKAAIDQQIRNMDPMEQWWFNFLYEGQMDIPITREDMDWAKTPVRVFKQDIRESFEAHCRRNGIRSAGSMGKGTDMILASTLKKMCPDLKNRVQEPVPEDRFDIKALGDGRQWAYEFPCLEECRNAMKQLLGTDIDWNAPPE